MWLVLPSVFQLPNGRRFRTHTHTRQISFNSDYTLRSYYLKQFFQRCWMNDSNSPNPNTGCFNEPCELLPTRHSHWPDDDDEQQIRGDSCNFQSIHNPIEKVQNPTNIYNIYLHKTLSNHERGCTTEYIIEDVSNHAACKKYHHETTTSNIFHDIY